MVSNGAVISLCLPLSAVCNEQGGLEEMEVAPDRSLEALILENGINGNQRHMYVFNYYELWLGHRYSVVWFQGLL